MIADSTLTWMPSVNRRNVLKQRLLSGQTHLWIIEQYSCRRVSNLSPAWPLLLEGVNNFLSKEIKNMYTQHTHAHTHSSYCKRKVQNPTTLQCGNLKSSGFYLCGIQNQMPLTWRLSVPLRLALTHLSPGALGSQVTTQALKGSPCGEVLAGVPPASPTSQEATLSPALRWPEDPEEPVCENQISHRWRTQGSKQRTSGEGKRSQHWLVRSPGPGKDGVLQSGAEAQRNAIADLLGTTVPVIQGGNTFQDPGRGLKPRQYCILCTVFS